MAPQYIYKDSKLVMPVIYFASKWAVWAEQHAEKGNECPTTKRSYELTVLIFICAVDAADHKK